VRAPRPSCGTANVMSVPPIDIAEEDWAIVRDILHRHVPDYTVWAFGFRAKRTARRFSDLDLAIITDTPLPFGLPVRCGRIFPTPTCRSAWTSWTGRRQARHSGVASSRTRSSSSQPGLTVPAAADDCPALSPVPDPVRRQRCVP
jgi:hypothetical protein